MKMTITSVTNSTPAIVTSFLACDSGSFNPGSKGALGFSHDRARIPKTAIIAKAKDIAIQGNWRAFGIGD
jgi:hypothetical protein